MAMSESAIIDRVGRRLIDETLGTAVLMAVIIGSGIIGGRIAGANVALVLLVNTVATGTTLAILTKIFGSISGANFNPAVVIAMFLSREVGWKLAASCLAAQVIGAVVGAHALRAIFADAVTFGVPNLQASAEHLGLVALGSSEFVGTFGLLATIFGTRRFRPAFTPTAVGLYIALVCWFTGSEMFANPAVTIARATCGSFAATALDSVLTVILSQVLGGVVATGVFGWLFSGKGDQGRTLTRAYDGAIDAKVPGNTARIITT